MRKEINFCFAAVLLVAVFCKAETLAQLDKERFAELMRTVIPKETTKQIDWYPDLLSAQKAAIEQEKPMFIWSMDGHPLGCT